MMKIFLMTMMMASIGILAEGNASNDNTKGKDVISDLSKTNHDIVKVPSKGKKHNENASKGIKKEEENSKENEKKGGKPFLDNKNDVNSNKLEAKKDKKINSDNNKKIIFDFKTKELITSSIIENENTSFKLININKFKYDVFIDGEPYSYNLNEGKDFNKLTEKGYIKKSFLNDVKKNSFTMGKILNFEELQKNKELINDNFRALQLNNNKIYSMIENEKNIENKLKRKVEVINIMNKINEIKNAQKILSEAQKFYENLVILVNSDILTNEILEIKKEMFKSYIKDYDDKVNDVVNIIKYYSQQILIIDNIKNFINRIDQNIYKNEIDALKKVLSKKNSIDSIYKLAFLYSEINESQFVVYSFIPNPESDNIKIKINVVSKKEKLNKIKIEVPLVMTGGFKVDFSSGMFISNIVDKKYVNKKDTKSTNTPYKLVSDSDSFSLGIASFMHAYFRWGEVLNVSLTLGLGFDQDVQFKTMLGLSFILGRKQRFIFTLGGAIGKSKDILEEDKDKETNELIIPNYSNKFRKLGWFLSVSYNFF